MTFLPELAGLRAKHIPLPPREDARRGAGVFGFSASDPACELIFAFGQRPFSLMLSSTAGPFLSISFDLSRTASELRVNEHALSIANAATGEHRIHLFVDASVIECTVNDSAALASRIYSPVKGPLTLKGPDVFSELELWEITPISKDRLTS